MDDIVEMTLDRTVSSETLDQALGDLVSALDPGDGSEEGAALPREVDVYRAAELVHLSISRSGTSDEGGEGVAIPDFYSRHQERALVAQGVARKKLKGIARACSESDHETCPTEAVCDLAEQADDSIVVDRLAAALLMPTKSVHFWGERLHWNGEKLAALYTVPVALAQARVETFTSSSY